MRSPGKNSVGLYLLLRRLKSKSAFSLLELLTVIFVMTLLLGIATPAVTSLQRNFRFTSDCSNVTKLIERGRTEATSLRTHVWIGIAQSTQNEATFLNITAFGSKDGSDDTSASNLQQLWKVNVLQDVRLGTDDETNLLASKFQQLITDNPIRPSTISATLSASIAKTPRNFTDWAIEFSPQGEVVNASRAWVALTLVPVKGNRQTAALNDLECLLISRDSGAIFYVRK